MKPLIVALDVESEKEALQLARHLAPWVDLFKVGPVLFLKGGEPLLRRLRSLGAQIFLDLKFHDIPSVVRRALERAGESGVYSATVHVAGGRAMLREAARARRRPRLWGVTVLTSLDGGDLKTLGVQRSLSEQVVAMARQAAKAGLEGVVASGDEVKDIRRAVRGPFTVVAPGIRLPPGQAGLPAWADDQKRRQTPWQARQNGADFFVVGRPILEAKDPLRVVRSIYALCKRGGVE